MARYLAEHVSRRKLQKRMPLNLEFLGFQSLMAYGRSNSTCFPRPYSAGLFSALGMNCMGELRTMRCRQKVVLLTPLTGKISAKCEMPELAHSANDDPKKV